MTAYVAPTRLGASGYFVCFKGIVWREVLRFLHQRERFLAALVRPLVWLFIFAAGFRQVLGVSIIPPYQTYVLYEVFVTPGLVGLILLFNAMLSSLTMVYDRETGAMRTLLVSPFPRSFLLISKLLGGVAVAMLQVYAFLLIAYFWEVEPPLIGYFTVLPALVLSGLMLGALALFMSSVIKQLENFAGVMNFVIFPMFFASSALYPLWRIKESSPLLFEICRAQPVHARRRTHPLRTLWPGRADIAGDRAWLSLLCFWRRQFTPTIPQRGCSAGVARQAEDDDMAPSNAVVGMIAASIITLGAPQALAAEATRPDWPCVQRKVATLTSAQMWDGPPVDDLTQWRDNEEITKLIAVLASRRVSLEQAAAAIARFAAAQPKERRDEALKLVFAGLLSTINSDRAIVMSGIERFQQRQRARAAEIERQGTAIRELKERAVNDEKARAELAAAEDRYNWDVRVFSERQQSLPLACEVPVLIEQRLFELGREVRSRMND